VTSKSLPASETRETSRDEDIPRGTHEKEVQAHVGFATKRPTSATTLAFMERLRESHMKTASLNGERGDDATPSLSRTESSGTSSRIEIVLRDPTSCSSKEINDNCVALQYQFPLEIVGN
jgi:hypothetical protein